MATTTRFYLFGVESVFPNYRMTEGIVAIGGFLLAEIMDGATKSVVGL
jgi:hypothetical protein